MVEVVFLAKCECDGSKMEEMRDVVVVIDLRWCGDGGGCDGSELEVMQRCDGEVLTWRCWI
jgi:hypothetical protein